MTVKGLNGSVRDMTQNKTVHARSITIRCISLHLRTKLSEQCVLTCFNNTRVLGALDLFLVGATFEHNVRCHI